MKKTFLLFVMMTALFISGYAKIWRINNNAGIAADFTTFHAAVNSSAVLAGDTVYMEPSNTQYATNSMTLNKRLIVVGPGYFLDPANATTPGNPGLQVTTIDSEIGFLRMGAGSDGTRFLGVTLAGSIYFTGANNISFEKVYFPSGIYYESGTNDATSFRKCFFNNGINISNSGTAVITNFICENNIFYGGAYITLTTLAGSGNIVRNNSVVGGNVFTLNNTYVANNIFAIGSQSTFTNCTIKNNLFQIAQTLPGTAVGNQLSVNMTNVYVGGATGSLDSRTALKAGSPAIAAGLTVGAVVTPDCGAYGATDPYKLSGIPNIPSIYALTVPVSIPSGSATMNVTFSTRNNN
ncbi:MAG: hypothetical protein H7Y86_21420 [Rhizobacter sp.]|nr:hypothetical protein [Ferruginibacter sp.]